MDICLCNTAKLLKFKFQSNLIANGMYGGHFEIKIYNNRIIAITNLIKKLTSVYKGESDDPVKLINEAFVIINTRKDSL